MNVVISYEEARDCGFRKPSKDGVGIYLRGSNTGEDCERLPFPLETCPCCGGGFKYTRGFTWIDPMALLSPYSEPKCTAILADDPFERHHHEYCWLCNPELLGSKAGLIWIGEQHYKSPGQFIEEANRMGISRKIAAIPNGFEVGEHAIFLAHAKGIYEKDEEGNYQWVPAIFMAFKPHMIDLVIDDPDNVPNKAIEIAKRLGEGKARIVKVIPNKEIEESEFGSFEDI